MDTSKFKVPFGLDGWHQAVEIEVDHRSGYVLVKGSPRICMDTAIRHGGGPDAPFTECTVFARLEHRGGPLKVSVIPKPEHLRALQPTLTLRRDFHGKGILATVGKSAIDERADNQLLLWPDAAPAEKAA